MSSARTPGSRSRGRGAGEAGGGGGDGGGGFLPSLPSPPPSSAASTAPALPTPRTHPLRPGSAKESSTRQWVETALLRISGQYERRFAQRLATAARAQAEAQAQGPSSTPVSNASDIGAGEDDLLGYASYAEAAADLGHVLDVLWVSGTPSLQIPFLLSLALAASDYLPAFPFAPLATFTLLHKLDAAFAALLAGDAAAAGRPLTMTEKVRLRGIIEGTRTRVARQASDEWEDIDGKDGGRGGEGTDTDMETETETETETEGELDDRGAGTAAGEGSASWEVEVARVFEHTIVELGMLLDAQAIMGGES